MPAQKIDIKRITDHLIDAKYTQADDIYPVLNTDTDEVVLVPVRDKFVINQDKLYYHLSCKMFAIENSAYQDILLALNLPSIDNQVITDKYCAERFDVMINNAVGELDYNAVFIAITGKNLSTKRLLQSLVDHNSLLALLTELGFFKHEKDIDSSISVSN